MVEIALTCLLLGGSFTPPPDWTIVSILTEAPPQSGAAMITMPTYSGVCYSIENGCERARADAERARIPRVQLKRTFQPGEKIQIPDSCVMEIKK